MQSPIYCSNILENLGVSGKVGAKSLLMPLRGVRLPCEIDIFFPKSGLSDEEFISNG